MKKFFAAIIFCVALAVNSFAMAADEPKILADSAILVEASTGRIIYEKNSNLEREPASMTKMLTCILALEKLNPTDEVTMNQAAVFTEDNTLSWSANDSVSARDMITAVMLVSENGGAVALANAIAGNNSDFAEMMNDKARAIGCKDSHFVNPNGLPNPNHYSTAADMARIAVYCMKNKDFREIVNTRRTSIHWIYPKDKWSELNNTNELLGKYKGADGIKTGWTNAAGGCLAASAKRGEIELIAIVMRSTNHDTRFDDAATLLNYGFERVRMVSGVDKYRTEKTVFVRGGKRATVHIRAEENLDFPLMAGEDSKLLQVTYDFPKVVDADIGIEKGKVLGEAVLRYDGKPVARVPLVARENVAKGFSLGSFFVKIAAPLLGK
ncbi:MAG: D-alanyl-D-alanine carboxypeptidase [Selenomonadaceae bacterium]|nr:D-alanyl-D-alanine carboxypeptidase [Selenomonadaceae bacterium]